MNDKPPFIADQGISLLKPGVDPRKYLDAEVGGQTRRAKDGPADPETEFERQFRPSREPGDADADDVESWWDAADRGQIAANRVADRSLHRLALVSEAGVGKSTTCQWLQAALCAQAGGNVALLVDVAELPARPDEFLQATLAEKLLQSPGNSTTGLGADAALRRRDEAQRLVVRLCRQERLTLIFDGLDHAGAAHVKTLHDILADPLLAPCRAIVAGRPYAFDLHWKTLFPNDAEGWAFARLAELTPEQQERYLGEARYKAIPDDARQILGVPRVLYYIRQKLTDDELDRIRTPSDVYWLATGHLIEEGLAGTRNPLGLSPDDVRMLLAATAFEMLAAGPWFVTQPLGEMQRLRLRVAARINTFNQGLGLTTTYTPRDIEPWFEQLDAMSGILGHALLERNCPRQIHWSNRSLQEFFAAVWMAKYCGAADAGMLWDCLYLPHFRAGRACYWMWRFAAEMPADARPSVSRGYPNTWVRAMAPLYRPGDGTAPGTRRSNEMIWRSWQTMQEYVKNGDAEAQRVLGEWKGEFERILKGQWDAAGGARPELWNVEPAERAKAQQHALQFTESFIEVAPGRVQMGSPSDDSGRYDDKPDGIEVEVARLSLNRFPTLNAWYRLFDPGHGTDLGRSYRWMPYAEVSRDADHPAIYVTWFDGWVFCQWACWERRACRLPREHEWEYCAKAGTTWHWGYWWGNDFDARRCTIDAEKTSALQPKVKPGKHAHDNPWRFRDILGNVWEWCNDWYCEVWSADDAAAGTARVLRGGSWLSSPRFARSALRYYWQPSISDRNVGFRVARALP